MRLGPVACTHNGQPETLLSYSVVLTISSLHWPCQVTYDWNTTGDKNQKFYGPMNLRETNRSSELPDSQAINISAQSPTVGYLPFQKSVMTAPPKEYMTGAKHQQQFNYWHWEQIHYPPNKIKGTIISYIHPSFKSQANILWVPRLTNSRESSDIQTWSKTGY